MKRLQQELQDTYNNWEASEINNREDMEKLRIELEKEKKKNAAKLIAIPEVRAILYVHMQRQQYVRQSHGHRP